MPFENWPPERREDVKILNEIDMQVNINKSSIETIISDYRTIESNIVNQSGQDHSLDITPEAYTSPVRGVCLARNGNTNDNSIGPVRGKIVNRCTKFICNKSNGVDLFRVVDCTFGIRLDVDYFVKSELNLYRKCLLTY